LAVDRVLCKKVETAILIFFSGRHW